MSKKHFKKQSLPHFKKYYFEIAITASKANWDKLWNPISNQCDVEGWKWKKKLRTSKSTYKKIK